MICFLSVLDKLNHEYTILKFTIVKLAKKMCITVIIEITVYPLIAIFFNVLHLLLSTVNNPTSVSLFCIKSVYMLSYICYIHIILYFLYIKYVLPNCILKQTVKQPVNVKSRYINATSVHDCLFFQ